MNPGYPDSVRKLPIVKILLAVALLLTVLFVSWYFWQKFVVQKVVSFEPEVGTSIRFGKTEPNNTQKIRDLLVSTNTKTSLRIKPGKYLAIFEGDGYQSQSQEIDIDSDQTIKTPKLEYSESKLQSILAQESAAIRSLINQVPMLNGYHITYEKLSGRGDWYGAQLAPPDKTKQDILRVIFHKKDIVWEMVGQPQLTLFIGDNPEVPVSLIRNINNQSF